MYKHVVNWTRSRFPHLKMSVVHSNMLVHNIVLRNTIHHRWCLWLMVHNVQRLLHHHLEEEIRLYYQIFEIVVHTYRTYLLKEEEMKVEPICSKCVCYLIKHKIQYETEGKNYRGKTYSIWQRYAVWFHRQGCYCKHYHQHLQQYDFLI